MAKKIISKDKLLESGIQYGHQTRSWNPAMKPFIQKAARGIHLINLDRSAQSLETAYNLAKKISERGGSFLFVGTTKQSSRTVRENAERVGAFYIDYRWLGGLITNFRTIQNSVNKLRRLERLEKANFEGYTKKESILMKKELDKLQKALGGIKYMRRIPQAIFVTSIRNEEIAIKEARKMGIPVFGVADTNVDPSVVNIPIYGNDDANKSVSLITTIIADGVAAGKNEKQLAAYVDDEKVEVLGVIPESEKPQRQPRYNNRNNNDRPQRQPRREETREETPVVVEEVKEEKVETPVVVEEVKEEKVETPVVVEETTVANEEVVEEVVIDDEAEKEKTLETVVNLVTEENGVDKISVVELYGIGPKTGDWLSEKGFGTIDKLAGMNPDSFTEEELSNLNLTGFKTFDKKVERLKMFVEEANTVIKNSNK